MYRSILCTLAVCAVVGCSRTAPEKPGELASGDSSKFDLGDYCIGEPIRHENLTIFPVISKRPRDDDRFITLDEGLKAGTVEILEVGGGAAANPSAPNAPPPNASPESDGVPSEAAPQPPNCDEDAVEIADDSQTTASNSDDGANTNDTVILGNVDQTNANDNQGEANFNNIAQQIGNRPTGAGGNDVNRLMVINRSEKPLYLMPGEVIIGGSQDRTIGQEIVIAPGEKPVPIEVFCVEQGRWNARHAQQTQQFLAAASGNQARKASVAIAANVKPSELAEKANQGQFIAAIGNLNKSARVATNAIDATGSKQAEVWKSVAKYNAASGIENATDAYTDQYAAEEVVARLDPYLEALLKPVAQTEQIVGVIVAVNGKVEQTDVFESTPLFQKLWPKLLKSYAVDAANTAKGEDADKLNTREDAVAFMRNAMETKVDGSKNNDQIAFTQRSNDRVVTFQSRLETEAAAQPAAASPNLGGVHFSGFSK